MIESTGTQPPKQEDKSASPSNCRVESAESIVRKEIIQRHLLDCAPERVIDCHRSICNTLTILNLSGCWSISKECLSLLFKECPLIESLDLRGCTTPDGLPYRFGESSVYPSVCQLLESVDSPLKKIQTDDLGLASTSDRLTEIWHRTNAKLGMLPQFVLDRALFKTIEAFDLSAFSCIGGLVCWLRVLDDAVFQDFIELHLSRGIRRLWVPYASYSQLSLLFSMDLSFFTSIHIDDASHLDASLLETLSKLQLPALKHLTLVHLDRSGAHTVQTWAGMPTFCSQLKTLTLRSKTPLDPNPFISAFSGRESIVKIDLLPVQRRGTIRREKVLINTLGLFEQEAIQTPASSAGAAWRQPIRVLS